MNEFRAFDKIPRLSRGCVVTEKIDGTNAQVAIRENDGEFHEAFDTQVGNLIIRAGSRNRWIAPDDDNYGFARWVWDNTDGLAILGVGHHYGEWWGNGIQRRYDMVAKRFSLFNVGRWTKSAIDAIDSGKQLVPECCDVVPILYQGNFSTDMVEAALEGLRVVGSRAAPGFMDPEGVIVYHEASGQMFKKTCKHDDEPKNAHPKKERLPQLKVVKNRATGGRRKEQLPYVGADRRVAA